MRNKLYYYIKQTNKPGFELKTSLDANAFVLHELQVKNKVILAREEGQSYTLISHHISLYETQDKNNPVLSQYHYTAYFYDEKKKEYQLHVYFNENDQLTAKEPIFSIKDEDRYNKQKINQEFSNSLIQLAIDNSSVFMADLRQQYQETLRDYERQYNESEQRLRSLSSDLVVNRTAYLAQLRNTINLLGQFSSYHHNTQYETLKEFFLRIEESMSSIPQEVTEAEYIESQVEAAPKLEKEVAVGSSSKTILATIINIPPSKKLVNELVKEASDRQYEFLQLSGNRKTPLDVKLNTFLLFLQAADDAWIATDDNSYSFTAKDLQDIQILISTCRDEAVKLLTSLLLNKQISLAEKLKRFANPIPDDLINLAFGTGNAEMLDFLLANSDFAINTYRLKNGLTPVLFCFEKHSKKTPKVTCLSVLIKHGASLMVKTADGLSVANHIASVDNHPLKKALIENAQVTLGDPLFYKMLISELNDYCRLPKVDDKVRSKLFMCVSQYQLALDLIVKKTPITSNELATVNQTVEEIKDQLDFDWERIKSSPIFQTKFEIYSESLKRYTGKLTKLELAQLKRQGTQYFEDANGLLKVLGKNIPNCEEAVFNTLDDYTKISDLKSELIDIQNEIKQISQKPKQRITRKANKEFNRLDKRQREIVHQLKELQTKYQITEELFSKVEIIHMLEESINSKLEKLKNLFKATLYDSSMPSNSMSRFLGLFSDLKEEDEGESVVSNPSLKEEEDISTNLNL